MRDTGSHRRKSRLASICLYCLTLGAVTPLSAATIFDTDEYAGDVTGLALPEGTFVALDYNRYIHGDEFASPANAILSKFGNPHALPADLEAYLGIVRFAYFASLWDHPFVIQFAVPYTAIQDANIGNQPVFNPLTGLGPQGKTNGIVDTPLLLTYGLISDPKNERFLGFTSYFFFPDGTYDKFNPVNISSPNQFTWAPQIEYAEGLEKVDPALKGFWFHLIPHAAIHSDGTAPLAVNPSLTPLGVLPGGEFRRTTEDPQFDVQALVSYFFSQAGYVAVGVEKSWGGYQYGVNPTGIFATGIPGVVAPFGKTLLFGDNFLAGRVEAVFPLSADFNIGINIYHEFEREVGFRQDFTAEIRLVKIWSPEANKPLK